jgi:hypothetical protein
LKLMCNVTIAYGNLKSENSSPETSKKLYGHEFGFCTPCMSFFLRSVTHAIQMHSTIVLRLRTYM